MKTLKKLYFISSRASAPVLPFAALLLMALLASCGSVAPFKEKATAEQRLSQAEEVNAFLYAGEEYEASATAYGEGENLIVVDKKDSKNATAKEKYLAASSAALAAYEKAAPLYTKAVLEETEEIISEAQAAGMENWNAEAYQNAAEENQAAYALLDQAAYAPAKEKSLTARAIIDEALEAGGVVKQGSTYTVILNRADRDMLWKISKRFLGDPLRWKEIYEQNSKLIEDPDLIFPGQVFTLPTP